MKKHKKIKRNKRDWLNALDSSDNGWYRYRATLDVDGNEYAISLTVADCSRQITLEFGGWQRSELEGRLKKVEKLISVLEQVKADVTLAIGDKHEET